MQVVFCHKRSKICQPRVVLIGFGRTKMKLPLFRRACIIVNTRGDLKRGWCFVTLLQWDESDGRVFVQWTRNEFIMYVFASIKIVISNNRIFNMGMDHEGTK